MLPESGKQEETSMDENRIDETRKYEENGFAVEPESGEIVVEGLTVEEAGKVKEIRKNFSGWKNSSKKSFRKSPGKKSRG